MTGRQAARLSTEGTSFQRSRTPLRMLAPRDNRIVGRFSLLSQHRGIERDRTVFEDNEGIDVDTCDLV
jgi:hypothetical protein